VSSYLFNSQLVTLPDGGTALVAARECGEVASVRGFLAAVLDEGTAIRAVHYVDIRQSMMNGGGPACLRLRVVLTAAEQSRVAPGVLWSESLDRKLVAWVERHYRDRLTPADLADPGLLGESRAALDELTPILGLGSLYDFQREGADCAADGPS
jgi:succinylarginine dihydrolase